VPNFLSAPQELERGFFLIKNLNYFLIKNVGKSGNTKPPSYQPVTTNPP
jgi:hypothetical protein